MQFGSSRLLSGCMCSHLLVFAGMTMSAAAQTTAPNEWTWISGSSTSDGPYGVFGTLGIAAAGNTPGGRLGAATWTDSSGNLWLYGGFGQGASGNSGDLNDLWEFNPSLNEWAWMGGSSLVNQRGVYGTLGTPSAGNAPGSPYSASVWSDKNGNVWLFGGSGLDANGKNGYLNDLWEFNPSTNEWTWMGGSSTVGNNCNYYFGCSRPGVYGTLGTPAAGNIPGGRDSASAWTDSSGNFWLFGGEGLDASGEYQKFNDLWEFNPSTREWAWMGGSSTIGTGCTGYFTCGQPGVYGTLGTAAAGNTPGSRSGASSLTDRSGNFWLFGGIGFDSGGNYSELNDLWEFNPSSNEWAWIGGSSTNHVNCDGFGNCGQYGVYGTQGVPAAGNTPGGLYAASSWIDSSGNFWLFGGDGYLSDNFDAWINDSWEYSPITKEWASMRGQTLAAIHHGPLHDTTPWGNYRTLGMPGGYPGGREFGASWTGSNGNLWFFGGIGFAAPGYDAYLNDLWEYQIPVFQQATLTSPPASSVLASIATFTWSKGSEVTQYQLMLGTGGPGSNDVYNSGYTTSNSATVTGLPSGNVTVYARLWSYVFGVWQYTDYTFIGAGTAVLLSPAPGSMLGTNATFTWSPATGSTMSSFWVGTTGPGSLNVYNSGSIAATSVSVTGLPSNGATLYARLGSYTRGTWQYVDYTYVESPTPVKSALISPAPGTVLGSSATFTWSQGTSVTGYALWLGTSGFGSSDIYNSGHTTALSSGSVSLPTNNVTIYAMLFSYVGGEWLYSYYTFFEAGPAAIESPAPGSVLGLAANFVWSPGTGATMSSLMLGSTGAGSSNLYNSGPTTATSAYVLHLPSNSGTVNARLGSYNGATWSYTDYTYTAAAPYVKAALLSPAPGTVLGSSATFTWSPGTGVTDYAFWLGTTQGSSDLYNSGHTAAMSSGLVALPSNDVPIYATLFSYVGGEWLYSSYTFIEAGPPKMLSPAPGSMLGFNASFLWSPGTGGTMSSLALGTTGVGSSNLYNSGTVSANSATVTGLPTNSGTIYARLGSYNGTTWTYTDYTYTESPPAVKAVLIGPIQGSVLGSSTAFTWSAGSHVTEYDLWVGTTGPGSNNLYNSGHTAAMSSGAVSIPQSGETVYVELYSYLNGAWQYTNYTFTAQ